jgi:DNA-binding LytR/AlgR family response regulator
LLRLKVVTRTGIEPPVRFRRRKPDQQRERRVPKSAFDCEASDYSLKPGQLEAAAKGPGARAAARPAAKPATLVPATEASSEQRDTFLIKTFTEKRPVKVSEIQRIVASGEYFWVYWHSSKKGHCSTSL